MVYYDNNIDDGSYSTNNFLSVISFFTFCFCFCFGFCVLPFGISSIFIGHCRFVVFHSIPRWVLAEKEIHFYFSVYIPLSPICLRYECYNNYIYDIHCDLQNILIFSNLFEDGNRRLLRGLGWMEYYSSTKIFSFSNEFWNYCNHFFCKRFTFFPYLSF